MIAVGSCNHAFRDLTRAERENLVGSAAQLKRSGLLQVFTLEETLSGICQPARRRLQRCKINRGANPLIGFEHPLLPQGKRRNSNFGVILGGSSSHRASFHLALLSGAGAHATAQSKDLRTLFLGNT